MFCNVSDGTVLITGRPIAGALNEQSVSVKQSVCQLGDTCCTFYTYSFS